MRIYVVLDWLQKMQNYLLVNPRDQFAIEDESIKNTKAVANANKQNVI